METIKIAGRAIGPLNPPMIVAEMSGNHNGSLEQALELVDAAAAAGAHALKLQTYTADTITLNAQTDDFFISNDKSLWAGRSLYELYQEAHTPWEWHAKIMERCHRLGLICFSTPFDHSAVDFLETLQVPCYKIASFENTDHALIRRVAQTGKPLIMSTGMATAAELDESVKTARAAGCKDLVLLKCTSSYPASPVDSHILTIPHMRELFQCQVGLSDHTLGLGVAVASVALGATFIEKHFTLSRAAGGVDAAFSLEPAELKALVIESERAWQSLGKPQYGARGEEIKSKQFRRSLYISQDMQAGDQLTPQNLRSVRPGYGLEPKYYDFALGKKIKMDAKKGTPLNWELLLGD